MALRILMLDFETTEASALKYMFEQDGFDVENAMFQKNTVALFRSGAYDLVLINNITDTKDSLKNCQMIRRESMVPIIILSEDADTIKKILAFDYGADEYLVKPYNDLELKSRAKAILRRQNYYLKVDVKNTEIQRGCVSINTLGRKVFINNELMNFTAKEFELFLMLISNPGKIFKREQLLEKVWGYAYYGNLRTVDVHIRRIREKIETVCPDTQMISTKWGQGYYFDEHSV